MVWKCCVILNLKNRIKCTEPQCVISTESERASRAKTHAQRYLHVLLFYLCLETFIRNRQYPAALWDPVLTLRCVF